MKIKTITIVSILMMFLACKKEAELSVPCSERTNSIEIVKKLLAGNYSWVYTVVTFQGSTSVQTPITTGLNYKYIFNDDGSVYYYENDTLKSTDTYTIGYEFEVTTYPSDSSTVVIIKDKQSASRKEFFRAYLCNDSSLFYNPYSSVDYKRYFKRN
ncbi:MAG: hypothetical protein QM763_11010 [Agriterribacter sp.]